MEETLNINGLKYIIETPTQLTLEQRNSVLKQLSVRFNINKMSATCKTTPTKVGDTISLSATGSGGIGPYTATFTKTGGNGTITSTGTLTATYTVVAADAGTSITFNATVTDSCTPPQTSAQEACTLSIDAASPVLTTITISGCSSSITVGSTCNLTAVCKDQYNNILLCPSLTWWTSQFSHVSVGTTGIVTGLSVGTSDVKAYYGNIISNTISVTVTAAPCNTPVCGFTVS